VLAQPEAKVEIEIKAVLEYIAFRQSGGDFHAVLSKGDVRIRYEEIGSGFALLVTPGGGLNSRVSKWQTAVFNAMEEFKHDFRCITMDQRNANGGDSAGPVPVENAWDAFADDQLVERI
jgi:pimeloyl-ACP methyl ester carboxylesterase